MTNLKQLPDHHRFQHCADAARRDNERIRSEYEMMQPREESAMLVGELHERIHFLLERKVDPDAHRF